MTIVCKHGVTAAQMQECLMQGWSSIATKRMVTRVEFCTSWPLIENDF